MQALKAALNELSEDAARHEEVCSVLDSIVLDVELAESINSRRRVQKKIAASKTEIQALRDACAEYRMVEAAREEERKTVADAFVQDLVKLTSKYEKMQQELAEAKEGMKSVSTLSRQLADSERRCRTLERRASNTMNANVVVAPISEQAGMVVTLPPEPALLVPVQPKNLKSLNDPSLFAVFSFLEAFDVLSTAQVDRTFFARVDKLFGIGSSVNMEKPSGAVSAQTNASDQSYSGINGDVSAVSTPNRTGKGTQSMPSASPNRLPITANNILSRGLSLLSRPASNSKGVNNEEGRAKDVEGDVSDQGGLDNGAPIAANFASSIAEKLR